VLAVFSLAGVAVVSAAGIGSAIAALAELPARHRTGAGSVAITPSPQTVTPAALLTALAREKQLITRTALARTARPDDPVLPALLTDHQAHAAAIEAAMAASLPTRATASPSASASAAAPTSGQLKADEQAAHDAAAAESATLHGAAAVLLASIAACEAGHVELLAS
jgi:hypothetical protein